MLVDAYSEMDLLTEVGRSLDAASDPVSALPATLAHIGQATGHWFAVVLAPERLRGQSRCVTSGPPGGELLRTLLDEGGNLGTRGKSALAQYGVVQIVTLPLRTQGTEVGALAAGSGAEAERWPAFLPALADRLASSIHSVRLLRQIERAKREWESTFDAMADGVTLHDLEFTVTRANWAFARTVKRAPREVVGRKCYALIHGASEPCAHCPAIALQAGAPARTLEVQEPRLDGKWLTTNVDPITSAEGQRVGFVHVLRDVTEARRLQELTIRNERMRALGEMATGVAHDFGNIMSTVSGWSQALLAGAADAEVRRAAEAVDQAARDGAEAVRRIQDYARLRRATAAEPVDLNRLVNEALEFARPRWRSESVRHGVEYQTAAELGDVPAVLANESELRQVLVNLIFNAIDAMPAGGLLQISTNTTDGVVLLRVADTGQGMSIDVQRRIFDPFFTTKAKGSGLGLAIAYGTIERYGGHIAVESVPGRGTTFTINLPIAPGRGRGNKRASRG